MRNSKKEGCFRCNTTDDYLWKCDICGRPMCGAHLHRLLDLDPVVQEMFAGMGAGSWFLCDDCVSLQELKLIDDLKRVDLPALVNVQFHTERARNYYRKRLTTGKKDRNIFGFGVQILVYLRDRIIQESKADAA